MASAAEIYANQLLPKRHGLPLWHPEPTKFGEVLIGDVGFVLDGCFYRLFNAIRTADDPVNAHCGVPPGFVPLKYNETVMLHTTVNYLPPGPLYSSSMRQTKIGGGAFVHGVGATYKFSCKNDQGAIVVLGDYATQSMVLQSCTAFQQYVHHNHDAWHDFAVSLGHTMDPSEIVLVSGWLKTSSWALAACTSFGHAHAVSIEAQIGSMAGVEFGVELSKDVAPSVEQRSGPLRDALPDSSKTQRDQCLFLRYYKIKKRRFFGKRLVAAGSRKQSLTDSDQAALTKILADLPVRQPSQGDTTREARDSVPSPLVEYAVDNLGDFEIQDEPETFYHDPLDDLLDYVLTHSGAKVAIVSHDDLFSLCSGGWPQNLASFLVECAPKIVVDIDGVGRIQSGEIHGSQEGGTDEGVEYMDALTSRTRTSGQQPALDLSSSAPSAPLHNSESQADLAANFGTTPCGHAFGDYCPDCTVSDDGFDSESQRDAVSDLDSLDLPGQDDCEQDEQRDEATDRQRLLLMALEVLRQVESTDNTGRRARSDAAEVGTYLSDVLNSAYFQPPCHTRSTSTQESGQDRRPDPGKYSARVLAAAPLAHIFLYRACARWSARPGLMAAHLSAGVVAGAMLYKKRRLKRLCHNNMDLA